MACNILMMITTTKYSNSEIGIVLIVAKQKYITKKKRWIMLSDQLKELAREINHVRSSNIENYIDGRTPKNDWYELERIRQRLYALSRKANA
jgi:hypothetical protein